MTGTVDDNLIERRRAEIEGARIAAFHEWWRSEGNAELRKSCACGWAHYIWDAALDSAVVELPSSVDAEWAARLFEIDEEDSGMAIGIASCANGAISACRDAIERAGLRVKS